MNQTITKLLAGKADNHMLPFFWQHGEDPETLRNYVAAIHQANCGAFCVESRPHPDFCGPKWWADMDVILEEARARNMKVWILDDSHFPTGYANGALKDKPDSLCRQNIFSKRTDTPEKQGIFRLNLQKAGLLSPPAWKANIFEKLLAGKKPARVFDDDQLIKVSAVSTTSGETIDLTDQVENSVLRWDKPAGSYAIQTLCLTRNSGCHRNYINMLDRASCQLLIDAVYEPHWQRYQADFGKTIAGFFSDEPELGNGPLYTMGNKLGTEQDLPWSKALESTLIQRLGPNWPLRLPLLWHEGEPKETAHVRWVYMDAVTQLVQEAFSYPLGDWCRAHGVMYIGHVIEDEGQHCRTGSSLGHYFRALEGQDMAGIDDIGGQVLPQGEDAPTLNQYRRSRNGEFYHYGLAKLAQSAAAIEPRKQGRAMCEIFGNYGWAEGVRLEKYLADHFLVRGINYYVPHAFSPKAFPDPDCPPHFYAHGHHPQYRHFGKLMAYMNRVATLTSSGQHNISVAILYHGEMEWMDNNAMPFEKVVRPLLDHQIDSHVIPGDVFQRPDDFKAQIGNPFWVNRQCYRALLVPGANTLPEAAIQGLCALSAAGLPVLFVGRKPKDLPQTLLACPVVPPDALPGILLEMGIEAPRLTPASHRVRILDITGEAPVYLLVNEAATPYQGTLSLPYAGRCCLYDPWANRLERAAFQVQNGRTEVELMLEPLKSLCLVFGDTPENLPAPLVVQGTEIPLGPWTRSLCGGKEYPHFGSPVPVSIPDTLAREMPKFSGYAQYETTFHVDIPQGLVLEIQDAAEGVEVFLEGVSAGIQIAPPFRYDLSGLAKAGKNTLILQVATTLERACYPLLDMRHKLLAPAPSGGSGLTGKVTLWQA